MEKVINFPRPLDFFVANVAVMMANGIPYFKPNYWYFFQYSWFFLLVKIFKPGLYNRAS